MEEKKEGLSYAEYQKREANRAVARTNLNIFRQLHVIDAGLAALNSGWVKLAPEVVSLLPELAGGQKLWQHIKNMQSGATPMDKIDEGLLPFGQEVFSDKSKLKLYTEYSAPSRPAPSFSGDASRRAPRAGPRLAPGTDDNEDIWRAIRAYQPTPAGLDIFKASVSRVGANWRLAIDGLLAADSSPEAAGLKDAFENIKVFDTALGLWNKGAGAVAKNSMKGVGGQMADFEKYLPMFGAAGLDLLEKLKALE